MKSLGLGSMFIKMFPATVMIPLLIFAAAIGLALNFMKEYPETISIVMTEFEKLGEIFNTLKDTLK